MIYDYRDQFLVILMVCNHIPLTTYDRFDPPLFCLLDEINGPKKIPMIREALADIPSSTARSSIGPFDNNHPTN